MQPQGRERRVVTVLMADVAGSTTIAEQLGPDRAKFLLDEVQRLMAGEVRALDGTVAQLLGDGMLALFGAPLAHDDDPERAGRAALAMRDAVDGYARDVRDAYGVDLALRVGVNTGPVVVSSELTDGEHRYNALGDTVNVAARLQALAEPGQVLAGEATARLVSEVLGVTALGERALKGRSAPVGAYSVCLEPEAPPRPRGKLVGRDYELAVLQRALDDLADGRGMVVALTGEAGIGKTRLSLQMREAFEGRILFLEGRAVSYTANTPFAAIGEVLRCWLGVAGGPDARQRLELKAKLAELFDGDAERLYPLLATTMGLMLEPDAAARLRRASREALQEQTFAAVRELVQRLADEQPVCLLLEDLHWADEATLELVQRLLELTEEASVGLLLLYRAERDHESWRLGEHARQLYPHRYREIELRPLPGRASRELAATLAGADLPDGIAEQLAERSGGNPFFLEAALRDLQERGALRMEDGRWTLADGDVSIPAQVRSVLQARLDRLDAGAREVVQVAAVIGRSFDLELLRAVLPDLPLTRALSELQRLDLVIEERRRPLPVFRFRHGLVQEAAYGMLVDARRKELHGRVGRALEALRGEDGESCAELARHFSEADEPERAARYLIAAGDAARAVAADREALGHYRQARRFLAKLGDDLRMRETLFKIALVQHLAFDFAGAEEAYDAAFCCRIVEPPVVTAPTERLRFASMRPESFAPGYVYSGEGASMTFALFRGLLRIEPDLSVVPELAENFRVSSDGLTYLFQLRDDLRWSDGEPLTAEDFAETWRRMRDQHLITSFMLDDVLEAEALDEVTLEVRLRRQRNSFLYLLASPWTFPWPIHRVDEDPEGWYEPDRIVGNGPFSIAEFDDEHALLRPNPHWTAARGNVAEVETRFITGDAALCAWRAGELDVVSGLHGEAGELEGDIVETAPFSTRFLGLRTDDALGDVRLRRAVAHAINRKDLLTLSRRRLSSSRRGGAVPTGVPGHNPMAALQYDPDAARALLAEAGYPGGEGLRPLVVDIVGRLDRPVVDELAAQLGRVGIRVAPRYGEDSKTLAPVSDDADMWIEGWSADYPDPDGFFLGLLERRLPRVAVRVPEVRKLFEKARAVNHQDERLRLFQDLDRLLVAELAVIVPVAYPRTAYVVRPWVHDLRVTPITLGQFDTVVLDVEARDAAAVEPDAAAAAS